MPTTIGPFANVPAPGDPLTSAWAQQLTGAVDRAGKGRVAYVACPVANQGGFTGTQTDISGSIATWGAVAGRVYTVSFQWVMTGTAQGLFYVFVVGSTGTPQYLRNVYAIPFANGYQTVHAQCVIVGAPTGAFSIKGQLASGAGTMTVEAGGHIMVEDIGSPTLGLIRAETRPGDD